jgi:hypothetical protein
VERGVAHGEELEALKLLSSIHYTYWNHSSACIAAEGKKTLS